MPPRIGVPVPPGGGPVPPPSALSGGGGTPAVAGAPAPAGAPTPVPSMVVVAPTTPAAIPRARRTPVARASSSGGGGICWRDVGIVFAIGLATAIAGCGIYGAGISSERGYQQIRSWHPPIVPGGVPSTSAPSITAPMLPTFFQPDPVVKAARERARQWEIERQQEAIDAINSR